MKRILKSALVAAVAGVGVGSSANALSISMSDLLQGYTGPIQINFVGYNEGAIYNVGDGTYTGAGSLDLLPQVAPTNGQLGEDSWTVFKVKTILDQFNNVLFTDNQLINGKHYEITGIVWGEVDVYLYQVTVGASQYQVIRGVGLNVAFWLDENPVGDGTQFTVPIGGPGARTGPYSYPNINEDPGALIWTGTSVALPGSGGAYDYETSVVLTGGVVTGGAGGMFAGDWTSNAAGTGLWNAGFQSVVNGPDFLVNFSINNSQTKYGFDVVVNDPLYTVAIPTPSAIWGGALLAGLVGLNFLRRRRAE